MSGTQTFLLPDLGEGLTEAEIVRWLVAVGDVVAVDAPVAEVETAKSIVEVPSPYAGVVAELHGPEGTTIDVGKPLITIGILSPSAETYREEEKAGSGNVLIGYGTPEGATSGRRRKPRTPTTAHRLPAEPSRATTPRSSATALGASVPAVPAVPDTAASPAAPGSSAHASSAHASAAAAAPQARVPLVISPLVRRMARDGGVDLRQVDGSGAGGLIVRRDVEAALSAKAEKPVVVEETADSRTGLVELRRVPMSGFRKAVAATLSRSRREIPEATTWVDVDATALLELRESLRSATDPGPGLLALMARFVVAGLKKHPELNGFVDTAREELVQYDGVNLGLAAQTERGLVVPAVADAHLLTARGLDAEIRRLTTAARDGRLTAHELACGSFTLNNYGSFGVDGSAAIINHPQVAILGVGRIIDRPWVVDGELAIRKLTQLSLVFDHRVCDGGTAAAFLRFVADAFESPAKILADL
ncbi:dihydrolipoamide acetyltransferase family protein [Kribbella catacumbae]|uniref:dihydrolipoamide acetyltransferase family protein n=1 Tax=Kribbella catacumbae TaxID=460086 RepID=UPI00037C65EC|nr:dihydrolipoamide acetyltransferase family protein [Kribbella catacumbae]